MSVFKRYASRAILTLVLAVSALGAIAAPANAGGYPIVYKQAGDHWSPMMGIPNGNVVTHWLSPGMQFVMICYTDLGYNYNGNYISNRWFYGESWSGYYGYVHSSYVYYQWAVRRC